MGAAMPIVMPEAGPGSRLLHEMSSVQGPRRGHSTLRVVDSNPSTTQRAPRGFREAQTLACLIAIILCKSAKSVEGILCL